MFIEEMKNTMNYKRTENGALGYATTGKDLLDLNFAVSSLRNASESDIKKRFRDVWYEDKNTALKWLFYARDVRGGLGERRLFRLCVTEIIDELPADVIDWIIEFGRFDDLFVLLNTKLKDNVIYTIKKILASDIADMNIHRPVTLLAKWMPSNNTSSKKTTELAKALSKALGMTPAEYRKTLSKLRAYIDVTEVKMSAKNWGAINYEAVPSRANLVYNNAFLRNDEERRRNYLSKLEKGEAKINASVLYPHDIVHKYSRIHGYSASMGSLDLAVEAMWKALPNYVNGDESTIVVADGSGSMTSNIGNTNITALEVANALAIYFAERCKGEFYNKYITFSNRPQLVDFKGRTTLYAKLRKALEHDEVANTNIEAVFDLILKTAINGNMSQNELPKNILVISDMEFDSATSGDVSSRLFDTITAKYASHGYKLPRLVFWNVNSRTGTVPLKQNTNGVVLVSGFSPAVVKMVLSNEVDPYKALLSVLNSERYNKIHL